MVRIAPKLGFLLAALTIVCVWSGHAHAQDLNAMNSQVQALHDAGRHAEASALAERLVPLVSAEYGEGSGEHADVLTTLAWAYAGEGRTTDAVRVYEQALKMGERANGPMHWWVAQTANNLAYEYWNLGRLDKAEALFRRSLDIREKIGHELPTVLGNLGSLLLKQGQVREAEGYFLRALAIVEKKRTDPTNVAIALNNMADLRQYQGQAAEAERFMLRSLEVREKAYGPNHQVTARGLTNLAHLYQKQSRPNDAFPLMLRSLQINLSTVGPNHSEVTRLLIMLAGSPFLPKQPQGIEAVERMLRGQLAHFESMQGKESLVADRIVSALVSLYFTANRLAEVEPLLQRRLAYAEKAGGRESQQMADVVDAFAFLYGKQGRFKEAIGAYQRGIAIEERLNGRESLVTIHTHGNLAGMYAGLKDWSSAAKELRRVVSFMSKRDRTGDLGRTEDRGQRLLWREQTYFHSLIQVLHRLGAADASNVEESFQTAQLVLLNDAGAALARMAARVAAGNDKLAATIRERQDLVLQRTANEQRLLQAVSNLQGKSSPQELDALRRTVSDLDKKLERIDALVRRDYAQYAAISVPEPLSIKALQAVLAANEAIAFFLDVPLAVNMETESFVWTITRTDVRWTKLASTPKSLEGKVRTLRCGLDQDGAWEWSNDKGRWIGRGEECQKLKPEGLGGNDALPFDVGLALALYKELLGPSESLLKNTDGSWKNLIVVPSASLAAIPFHVLVTDTTAGSSGSDYTAAKWLVHRQAVSVLPSVVSLKALRDFARSSNAPNPFIGFGNPLIHGPRSDNKSAWKRQNCSQKGEQDAGGGRKIARTSKQLFRGELADVDTLRAQEPLPETAGELCQVGSSVGAGDAAIYLGAKATERTVKTLSADGTLARARILHFATHGLLAQETKSISGAPEEPALLLTPPKQATKEDDGLLTASEIALLKLDADWVVLSACNTAGGKSALETEPLSGLARAFFYAGARTLLVTHWYVNSQAAVALVTKTFSELAGKPQIGRADALRLSMLELASRPDTAHPAMWAPFVVVGEAGR